MFEEDRESANEGKVHICGLELCDNLDKKIIVIICSLSR